MRNTHMHFLHFSSRFLLINNVVYIQQKGINEVHRSQALNFEYFYGNYEQMKIYSLLGYM